MYGHRRRQVAVVLGMRLGIGLLEQIELELRPGHRLEARGPRPLDLRRSTCRGDATTGEPSSHSTSHRTSAVPASQGTRRIVARSGFRWKSP